MSKAIDLENGLPAIKTWVEGKFVEKESGKGLSTNDYTTDEKTKLAGIAAGAEVNVQSDWSQNITTADDYIKNKPSIPTATTTTPKMDGTAAVGSETKWAKGDHVHPTDTSRAPISHASSSTTYGAGTNSNYGHVKLSDATDGTASATSGGTAASPKAVSDALVAAKAYADSVAGDTKTVWYGTSSTGSDTATKVVTTSTGDFSLTEGNRVLVLFDNAQGEPSGSTRPKIQVDSTSATTILSYKSGSSMKELRNSWAAGEVVEFVYVGSYFVMVDSAEASTTSYGVTKLEDSTSSTSTTTAATPNSVKAAYDLANGKAPTSHASSSTTYGVGTASNYGHLKLSDSTSSTSSTTSGTAATPKAVKDALDSAKSYADGIGNNIPSPADSAPLMDGTAATGTSDDYAREDHVHPTDTSRAPLASPALTGTPTAPTAAAGTNTTQIATTAFVKTAVTNAAPSDFTAPTASAAGTHGLVPAPAANKMSDILTASGFRTIDIIDAVEGVETLGSVSLKSNKLEFLLNIGSGSDFGMVSLSDSTNLVSGEEQGTAATPTAVKAVKDAIPAASTTNPSMDGTASYGSGTDYARANHVHPTDTSRAPTSHASSDTTYGAGTSSNYGHVKLSDSTTSTTGTSGGTAATPKAVKDALDAAKTYADGKVTGLYNYKGSVATYANLPASPTTGDVYNVEAAYGDYPAGTNWAWTGSAWDALGGSFTITFATAAEVTAVLEA